MQDLFHSIWGGTGAQSLDLSLSLFIVLLPYLLYKLHQRRRKHKVGFITISIPLSDLTCNGQADTVFGNQHGCQPMTAEFPVKWPLGIDVLRAQLAAIADNRLFAYQKPFIDNLGPNFKIKMLGAMAYTTIDPNNLEAILSTRFEGI